MASGSEDIPIVRLALLFALSSWLMLDRIRGTTMMETLNQSSEILRKPLCHVSANKEIPSDSSVAECLWTAT